MSWIEITLYAGALIGFVSMGALVARSPTFWVRLAIAGIKAALPFVIKVFTKPASPEELKKFHDRVARGEDYGLPGQRKTPK